MAAVKKGVVMYRGDTGRPPSNLSTSRISGYAGLTDALLETFVEFLEDVTLCNLSGRSYNIKTTGAEAAPDTDANIDIKAHVYMKNPADDTVVRFSYPAPVEADFEETPEGTRMTADALAAFMVAFNACVALTGDNMLVGLYGTKTQKP
jgi:hypothetical protein